MSLHIAVYGDKFDCLKTEACRCWTVSQHIKVTNEPEFKQYCRENSYVIFDDTEDKKSVGDLEEQFSDEDDGYFLDDKLHPNENNNEASNDWLLSHCMDATATVASNTSSGRDGKNFMVSARTEDNIEMEEEEEIPVEFLVNDNVKPTIDDDLRLINLKPGIYILAGKNSNRTDRSEKRGRFDYSQFKVFGTL